MTFKLLPCNMNVICGRGEALFISLELLQDITHVKCRKHLMALLCLTQEEAREEMNITSAAQPSSHCSSTRMVQLPLRVQGLCAAWGQHTLPTGQGGLSAEPASWPFQVSME